MLLEWTLKTMSMTFFLEMFLRQALKMPYTAEDERIRDGILKVPLFCHVEVANVLGLSIRRIRLDARSLAEALDTLKSLSIETVAVHSGEDMLSLVRTMRAHGLTAYDVLYVELAIQLSLPLGTLDRQMARAAKAAGISLVADTAN